MKRLIIFFVGFLLLCVLSYFIGYYGTYRQSNKKSTHTLTDQNHSTATVDANRTQQPYYLLISEDQCLMIYKMPERELYDSVDLQSLWIEDEEEQLQKGIRLQSLQEVFEFLENRMS